MTIERVVCAPFQPVKGWVIFDDIVTVCMGRAYLKKQTLYYRQINRDVIVHILLISIRVNQKSRIYKLGSKV